MLDVEGFLDLPLHAIHQTCKSSQLIILNVFNYKMQRFLQFSGKLNTRKIVKTCPFRFLLDYYGDSRDVMFPQFPNHFLPFPMLFTHLSPSVSTIFSGVSTVSPQCFPRFLFCDFVTKCYKSSLQNASGVLLQNTTVLLQNVTAITKCDSYQKMRRCSIQSNTNSQI